MLTANFKHEFIELCKDLNRDADVIFVREKIFVEGITLDNACEIARVVENGTDYYVFFKTLGSDFMFEFTPKAY